MEELSERLKELVKGYFEEAEQLAWSELEFRSCSHEQFAQVVRDWAYEQMSDDIDDHLDQMQKDLFLTISEAGDYYY